MITFLFALIVLIGGYFIYGLIVERAFGADKTRETPALMKADGVDYVEMPTWKVFLIQLLNITGVGPIFGAIMGACYGPSIFLWIVFGSIFAGAVHDYLTGMISLRMGGKTLPEIISSQLGRRIRVIMAIMTSGLLVIVVAVFVVTPSTLLATLSPEWMTATVWTCIICFYYVLATLLPINKLIGNLYPLFGLALVFMALGIFGYIILHGVTIPLNINELFVNYSAGGDKTPIFPMLCVTVSGGAISGFHATQCPLMARCMKNEKNGRLVFYGTMIVASIIALIWAAAAIAFTRGFDGLNGFFADKTITPGVLVHQISETWLGKIGGAIAVLGVTAVSITTGDTAMRSLRLTLADFFHVDQSKFFKRLILVVPILALVTLFIQLDFSVLWRYTAWATQVFASFTLWAATIWLARNGRSFFVAIIPAMFISTLSITYIIFAPSGVGGTGLSFANSLWLAMVATTILLLMFVRWYMRLQSLDTKLKLS